MSIENEIHGISYIGKKSSNEHLVKLRSGQREYSQGVYRCGDKAWYVKKTEKQYALLEVLAANYFAFLLGQPFCPETRLLITADNNYYVMSQFVEFDELNPPLVPQHLAYILVGSFIIADGDCLPKNLKQKNGQAFRIDFGAADLNASDKINHDIMFITSVNDMHTGFQTRLFSQNLTKEEFLKAIKRIVLQQQQGSFDWQSWQPLAINTDYSLEQMKNFLEQRLHFLHAHIFDQTHPLSLITLNNTPELEKLARFYELLTQEKIANQDFIFFPIHSSELATRHLLYQKQHQEQPKQFTDRLRETYSKQFFESRDQETKYNELDKFILLHFPNPKKIKTLSETANEIAAAIKSQQSTTNESSPLLHNADTNSQSSCWMLFFCCDNESTANQNRRFLKDVSQPEHNGNKPTKPS